MAVYLILWTAPVIYAARRVYTIIAIVFECSSFVTFTDVGAGCVLAHVATESIKFGTLVDIAAGFFVVVEFVTSLAQTDDTNRVVVSAYLNRKFVLYSFSIL